MSTARRYRGKESRPIPVWNGVLEHRERIDAAVWVFLWLLDGITEDREAAGLVLGGAPIKASRIGRDLAFDEKTVLRHLEALETGRYIRRRRTPYGFAIEVCNSRKFGIWSSSKRSDKNVLYKEDAARNAAIDAAATQAPRVLNPQGEVWGFLGINPCGPISFRVLLESRWKTRNGHRPSDVVGETVDAWETAEGEKLRRTPQLFKALAELRQKEKQESRSSRTTEAPIRTLTAEEIPA